MRSRAFLAAFLAIALLPARVAPGNSTDYVRPLKGPIVRHFEKPPTPFSAGHRGIDMAAPLGTRVVASGSGTVAFAGQVGGDLFVSIDHADGLRTTYSFLSVILVRAGDAVAQGQAVARSGNCHAGARDPCLHFGVRRGAEYLDPEPFLLGTIRRNLWQVIRLAPDAA